MEKQRIIQEFVPGKQITLAHIIANPTADIYVKLGIAEDMRKSIGIMTITPSEGAIIASDIASKASDVRLAYIDRFNGSVVITGDVSAVESALEDVLSVLENVMQFSSTVITRT